MTAMSATGGHSDTRKITPRVEFWNSFFSVTHPLSVHICSCHGYHRCLRLSAIVNVIAMAIMVPSLFRAGPLITHSSPVGRGAGLAFSAGGRPSGTHREIGHLKLCPASALAEAGLPAS